MVANRNLDMDVIYTKETGRGDALLLGLGRSRAQNALLDWARAEKGLHDFMPDYHRLQLERWVWDQKADLKGRVLDIGVENRREWVGEGYQTFGERDCDVNGDLEAMPFEDNSLDAIICTEVMEHVKNPSKAVTEMHRVLKGGGLLLATSPFAWPWHGSEDYHDYWRLTHEGWKLLLQEFASVSVSKVEWTDEGRVLMEMVRRFEGWGFGGEVKMHTGYNVRAIK